MSKKPRRERVSPQESVEGPDVNARPERTVDPDDKDSSPSQSQRRPKPDFPTGAQLVRKIFQPRRKK